MSTALDIAAEAVGIALALSSTGVHINSTDPFEIQPSDAFDNKFSAFHTELRVFLEHLIENLPNVLEAKIRGLSITDDTVISDVVDAVEAIILAK